MRVQDLHIDDKTLWEQYVTYFSQGQYDQAFQLLSNAQLVDKAVIADVINAANNAVYNAEQPYYTNVEDKLMSLLTSFNMAVANLVNKQMYDETTNYANGNFVIYDSKLYVYIASEASSGNLPTDTTHWLYVGLQGEKGAIGIDLKLRYNWISTAQYVKNDVVVYKDALYFAISANTNIQPDTDTSIWGVLYNIPIAKIHVDATAPISPYMGEIWFKEY